VIAGRSSESATEASSPSSYASCDVRFPVGDARLLIADHR
jgi:hypothetical protein